LVATRFYFYFFGTLPLRCAVIMPPKEKSTKTETADQQEAEKPKLGAAAAKDDDSEDTFLFRICVRSCLRAAYQNIYFNCRRALLLRL